MRERGSNTRDLVNVTRTILRYSIGLAVISNDYLWMLDGMYNRRLEDTTLSGSIHSVVKVIQTPPSRNELNQN